MYKFLFAVFILLAGHIAQAQVKIGTNPTVIGASSLLELESTSKALLLTRVHDTTKIAVPVNGMLIYDSASKSIQAYENNKWQKLFSYLRSSQPLPLMEYQHAAAIINRRYAIMPHPGTLSSAHLSSVRLSPVHLSSVRLSFVHLSFAHLSSDRLSSRRRRDLGDTA